MLMLKKVIKNEENSRLSFTYSLNTYPYTLDEHLHLHDNCIHTEPLEKEKLQWMLAQTKDNVNSTLENGESARFDFEGQLITKGSDIPAHVGLHHHGLEPDAAGYTIEELFILTRSSFPQQKIIGLTTLAHIFDKVIISNDKCLNNFII